MVYSSAVQPGRWMQLALDSLLETMSSGTSSFRTAGSSVMKTLEAMQSLSSEFLELPSTRPSIFDPLASVDPWIERCRCCNDLLALFLHNRPIAIFPASSLDLTSLNQLLFRVRQRSSRI
jgi:hypothetical protein